MTIRTFLERILHASTAAELNWEALNADLKSAGFARRSGLGRIARYRLEYLHHLDQLRDARPNDTGVVVDLAQKVVQAGTRWDRIVKESVAPEFDFHATYNPDDPQ